MLARKYYRILHFIALFAVVFASLAPTVSHALAAHTGNNSFSQTICTTNGEKVVIDVVTTKGNLLSTELPTNQDQQNAKPKNMGMHFDHCPFCSAGAANVVIAPAPAWILMLAEQAKTIDFDYVTPVQPSFIQTAHPSRAPPVL
jgi:hypothetical protein